VMTSTPPEIEVGRKYSDGGSDLREPAFTSGARQSPRSGDCGTQDTSLRP